MVLNSQDFAILRTPRFFEKKIIEAIRIIISIWSLKIKYELFINLVKSLRISSTKTYFLLLMIKIWILIKNNWKMVWLITVGGWFQRVKCTVPGNHATYITHAMIFFIPIRHSVACQCIEKYEWVNSSVRCSWHNFVNK